MNKQLLGKVVSILLIISGSVTFGINVSEGKDFSRLALNIIVVCFGIFYNIANTLKKK